MNRMIDLHMENVLKHFTAGLINKEGKSYFSLGESDKIEYKQSLQISGEIVNRSYLKTISGFANNKGGVMIFGVAPENFELVGIQEKYENLDNKYFSATFADNMDGPFDFTFFTSRIEGKVIGFLFVKEAGSKPVILKSNFDSNGEKGVAGDIYFRYPGRTTRISSVDLRVIIAQEVKLNVNKILNKVEYIANQGLGNVAILNTQSGELNTENNAAKFVLSREILNDINLIQEGKIVQKEGAPAYVIKGVVEVATERIVEKRVILNSGDIFNSFFSQKCDEPMEYIKELLYKETPYYPLFFFIRAARLSDYEIIDFIQAQTEHDIKKVTKDKIVNRINGKVTLTKAGKVFTGLRIEEFPFERPDADIKAIAAVLKLSGNSKVVSAARSAAYAFLVRHLDIPENLYKRHTKEIVEAFTHLLPEDLILQPEYFLNILSLLYKKIKHTDSVIKSHFRKAVCFCDEALFKQRSV